MKNPLLLLLLTLLVALPLSAQEVKLLGYGQVYYDLEPSAHGSNTFGVKIAEVRAKFSLSDHWKAGALVGLHTPAMLKELHLSYEVTPALKLRMGQMMTPYGYENQFAPYNNPLCFGMTRATTYLVGVAGDPLYHGTTGRDIGLELSGDLWQKLLSYKLVLMNGQGINHPDLGPSKMYGGSLYIRPLKQLTLHLSYMGGENHAMAAGKGVSQGEGYERQRLSGAIALETAPVTILGEYLYGRDSQVAAQGGYLTAVGHLPGRYDLIASADYFSEDLPSSRPVVATTLGVQKWFSRLCRCQLAYHLDAPEGESHNPMTHHLRMQMQVYF